MAGGERRGNEVCGVKRVKKLVGRHFLVDVTSWQETKRHVIRRVR